VEQTQLASSNVCGLRPGGMAAVLICLAVMSNLASAASSAAPDLKARMQSNYDKLPLSFEANQGQTDAQVKFLSRGRGYALFLTPSEAVLSLKKPQARAKAASLAKSPPSPETEETVLRMQLIGSNSAPKVLGKEALPGRVNYLIGKDPAKWHTKIPTYGKVAYEDVYPGVELVYYGNQGQLEYDFVVAPGADPHTIKLAFKGADHIQVNPAGELVLHTASGDIRMHKPVIYQEIGGARKPVDGGYVLKDDHRVGFRVTAWDRAQPLVIDPVLSYSTYLGGNADDKGNDIAVSLAGNAYVVGTTASTNFPTAKPLQEANGGETDVFVAKLSRDGSALIYATYLGGSGTEEGMGIALNLRGNAYITGTTASTDFPTVHALQPDNGGNFDAFVAELSRDGSALIYSTYLGGSGNEIDAFRSHSNIGVDFRGNAYVVGTTYSADFPTKAGAFQRNLKGPNDAFVAKLSRDGTALIYSTYLGGSGYEIGLAIDVTPRGDAYVAGSIFFSSDFPTTPGAFQTSCGSDVTVTKLRRNGSGLVYSTCIGGSDFDFAGGIDVDARGHAYVAGNTVSSDFPTARALQSAYGGNRDAFVLKLTPGGSNLIYSTYLGGSKADLAFDIAVDVRGNAYITGGSESSDLATVNPLQATCHANAFGDCGDAIVATLNPTGSSLTFSTFLGGSGSDGGEGIAVDILGNSYITGVTFDTNDFPTEKPLQPLLGGGRTDAFVAKIGRDNRP
jgi:hypothetical protein